MEAGSQPPDRTRTGRPGHLPGSPAKGYNACDGMAVGLFSALSVADGRGTIAHIKVSRGNVKRVLEEALGFSGILERKQWCGQTVAVDRIIR